MKKIVILFACALAFVPGLWSNEDQNPASQRQETAPLSIQVYQREEIVPLLPLLNTWNTDAFGPFPYLYAPREDQLISMADFAYVNEKNALVIVAKKGEQIVGIAGGAPLDSFYMANHYFTPELIKSMKNKEYDPSDYFYVGYFLIAPEFRGDLSVIESIYDRLVEFSRSIGKTQLAYISVLLADNHPMKPDVFSSPEPWGTAITGFSSMDLFTQMQWPTYQADGSIADQKHILQFYRKAI